MFGKTEISSVQIFILVCNFRRIKKLEKFFYTYFDQTLQNCPKKSAGAVIINKVHRWKGKETKNNGYTVGKLVKAGMRCI